MTMKKKSAQSAAYNAIRDGIIHGDYSGGMKLIEEKLASELGVSRTPVREAIRRLEQEGLVKSKKVIKPTETDLRNQFEIRILIECYAASKAASYMLKETREKLRLTIETARVSDSFEETIEQNKVFHDLILQESRNPIMIDTVNRMQAIIYLFSRAVVVHNRPGLLDEHEEIYQAIVEMDPEKASIRMREHLEKDLEFTLRIV